MPPTDRLDWRTSSRTGAGENCVEVRVVPPHAVSDGTATRSA